MKRNAVCRPNITDVEQNLLPPPAGVLSSVTSEQTLPLTATAKSRSLPQSKHMQATTTQQATHANTGASHTTASSRLSLQWWCFAPWKEKNVWAYMTSCVFGVAMSKVLSFTSLSLVCCGRAPSFSKSSIVIWILILNQPCLILSGQI